MFELLSKLEVGDWVLVEPAMHDHDRLSSLCIWLLPDRPDFDAKKQAWSHNGQRLGSWDYDNDKTAFYTFTRSEGCKKFYSMAPFWTETGHTTANFAGFLFDMFWGASVTLRKQQGVDRAGMTTLVVWSGDTDYECGRKVCEYLDNGQPLLPNADLTVDYVSRLHGGCYNEVMFRKIVAYCRDNDRRHVVTFAFQI